MNAKIRAIHHEIGELVSVSALTGVLENPTWGRYLENLGIRNFSRLHPDQLYKKVKSCISATFEKANVTGKDIDAFIIFSTTFDPYVAHSDMAKLSVELDMVKAIPYGVFHNQCTNFTQALELSNFLLNSDDKKSILLVGCDILDENRGERIMENRVSVYSDIVVTCLVEKTDEPGWEIESIQHRYLPNLATYTSAQDVVKFIQDYSRGVQEVVGKVYENTKMNASKYDMLITANYNQSVVKNLAELAGISTEKLDVSCAAKYGHCFSADHFITLQKRLENNSVMPNETYLLLAVGGFVVFSATSLRWTQ